MEELTVLSMDLRHRVDGARERIRLMGYKADEVCSMLSFALLCTVWLFTREMPKPCSAAEHGGAMGHVKESEWWERSGKK